MENTLSATHKCSEHLEFRESDDLQPHGEVTHSEWYRCTVCGESFDVDDLPPQDEEDAEEDEIPPATESRFASDGYYRRKIGYDESRADEGDLCF